MRQAGFLFVIALIVVATTATFNLSGLGMVTSFLGDWLSRFSFQTDPAAGFNTVFLLTIYEPLLVAAGLTGLAFVILRKNLLELTFAGWLLGLLLLDVAMGGRPNGSAILPLTPLAFLAAMALAHLWAGLRRWGTWGNEGILLGTGLVMAGLGYILLTDWLTRRLPPR